MKRYWFIVLICLIGLGLSSTATIAHSKTPQINAPYFGSDDIRFKEMGIFWFGQVNDQTNYADVRIGYNNDHLKVNVTLFDHWLWYDQSPTPADLMNWDAVSL